MIEHYTGKLRAGPNGGFGFGPVNAIFEAESDVYGDLVASLLTVPSRPTMESDARRLVACWNACDGFTTEHLTSITDLGDTLLTRFRARDMAEIELTAERDMLVDFAKLVLRGLESGAVKSKLIIDMDPDAEQLDMRPLADIARAAIAAAEAAEAHTGEKT